MTHSLPLSQTPRRSGKITFSWIYFYCYFLLPLESKFNPEYNIQYLAIFLVFVQPFLYMFISSQIVLFPKKKKKNQSKCRKKCSPCKNVLFALENRQLFILVQALFNDFQNTKLTRNISLWVLRLGMKILQNVLNAMVNFFFLEIHILWKFKLVGLEGTRQFRTLWTISMHL